MCISVLINVPLNGGWVWFYICSCTSTYMYYCCGFKTDFWQYTSTYREQPSVNFLNQLIVQLGDGDLAGTRAWSSFPNLNLLLQPDEIAIPIIRVRATTRWPQLV